MTDNQHYRLLTSGLAKALEHEAAALKLVTDQQVRVRNAARDAFQEHRDPMCVFAETVAQSSVVHVNALIQLNAGMTERIRVVDHAIWAGGSHPVLPAPD